MHKLRFFASALLIIFAFAAISPILAADTDTLYSMIDETLSALGKSDPADCGYGDEWIAVARIRAGYGVDDGYVERVADAIPDNIGAVERQRCALALAAAGGGSIDAVTTTPDLTIGRQGIMSYIYGLHLYNNGVCGSMPRGELMGAILELQAADGGWGVRAGASDADVTAMAVTALAGAGGGDEIEDAISAAVSFLASRQGDGGAYSSYGVENAESAAQVIIALCSLGIDPDLDERFSSVTAFLDGFRLESGAYCHVAGGGENRMATAQALTALVALLRLREGKSPFYLFAGDTDDDASATGAETDAPASDSAASESAPAESAPADSPSRFGSVHLKLLIAGAIFLSGGVCIAIAFFSGERRPKRYAVVIAVCVILSAIVFLLRIETPAEHFAPETGADSSESAGVVVFSIDATDAGGGVLLAPRDIAFHDGDTVLDLLDEAARAASLTVDRSSGYVRGIAGIAEFDHGAMSGWTYRVNGVVPPIGAADYRVADGDVIEWVYVRGERGA